MADAIAMITQSLIDNWMLFALIVSIIFNFVPWIGLIIMNFFNGNILEEIMATFDRTRVKILKIYQNGQAENFYRKMIPDEKKILVEKGKDGIDQTITVTTPPIPDRRSHRQIYVAIEGQEGTKDLLRDSKYDVNTPQKRMAFSMYFELGREYERSYATQQPLLDLMKWAQLGIPTLLLILVLIITYSQNGVLTDIAKAVGVGA